MRKIFILFTILFAVAISWGSDDLAMAPNFAPHALGAKQIAPGTSHKFTFSLTQSKGKLSKNEHGEVIDSANAYDYRFNFTPFHITWPKLENTQGAENWSGHTFGGGFFLDAHYSILLKLGITPTIVQWLGPVYLSAAYDLTFGHYFGTNEKKEFETKHSESKFTGAFNLGGGAIAFMNNHGLGFGVHGGLRQIHLINARISKEYPKNSEGFHVNDKIYYYGLDIISYSNLPLLNETNSKGHFGMVNSFEMGVHSFNTPIVYWNISLSFLL